MLEEAGPVDGGEAPPPGAPPPLMTAAGDEVCAGDWRGAAFEVEVVGMGAAGDPEPEPDPDPDDPEPKPAPPANLPAIHCVSKAASVLPIGVKLNT